MPKGEDFKHVISSTVIKVIANAGDRYATYVLQARATRPGAHARLDGKKIQYTVEVFTDGARRGRPVLGPPRCRLVDLCLSVSGNFDLKRAAHP